MPSNATSPAATILLAIAVAVIGYVVVLTWLWPTDLEAEAKRRIAREGAPPRQVASAPAISVSPPARPAPTPPSAAPLATPRRRGTGSADRRCHVNTRSVAADRDATRARQYTAASTVRPNRASRSRCRRSQCGAAIDAGSG
jgi:hypothetical protein